MKKTFRNYLKKDYITQLKKLDEVLGFTVEEYQSYFIAFKGDSFRKLPKHIKKTCTCQELNRAKYKISDIKLDSEFVHPKDRK